MTVWQRVPARARAGLRFALATILIGPATFSLTAWAMSQFLVPWQYILHSHLETTIHFTCYVAVFFPAVAWARSRGNFSWFLRFAGYCLLSILATALAVVIAKATGLAPEPLADSFRMTVAYGLVLSPALLLIEHIWDSLHSAREESERRALDQERQRRAAAEARWTSLESRLHPHFVFNTLASIRELLHRDPRHADHMIQCFAGLLRFSLDAPQRPLIPLEEELEMVTGYLRIEQMRLGNRLKWSLETNPAALQWKLPSLSVLTLVENAVKHSISVRRTGGSIHIGARLERGMLVVDVANDGPDFKESALTPGHGLHLLRERLQTLYGAAAALLISPREPGVAVALEIPSQTLELVPDAQTPLLRRG